MNHSFKKSGVFLPQQGTTQEAPHSMTLEQFVSCKVFLQEFCFLQNYNEIYLYINSESIQQHTSVLTLNKLGMADTSRVMFIFYRVLAFETC
jgi:predicted metalloprotease